MFTLKNHPKKHKMNLALRSLKSAYMKYMVIIILAMCAVQHVWAQTLFVDINKGQQSANGTKEEPLLSIEEAVSRANKFSENKPVVIKVAPGLYTLTNPLLIEKTVATNNYSIEALIMPDDTNWLPAKMPVIQVIADSNRPGKLQHASIAIEIERNDVSIKGIKFLGNPNPSSEYFYAIERKDKALKNLEISQCYFIGDKNSASIQGAVFAQGEGIRINHCIFYNCKNAVLSFLNVKDFSFMHSIIYGAYEAAFWFGYGEDADLPFVFRNNIIANCNYTIVGYKGTRHNYVFNNSVFTDNKHYLGFNGDIIEPDTLNKPIENNIQKTGKVILNEVTAEGIPKNYLNLSSNSAGKELHAGIFIKNKIVEAMAQ